MLHDLVWPRQHSEALYPVVHCRACAVQADVTVGEVPGGSGLRGVLAARNFVTGEAVISLPTRLAIGLGLHTFTPQVRCSARVTYGRLSVRVAP